MNFSCKTKIYLADINRVDESRLSELSRERAEKAVRYKMADDRKRSISAGLLLSRFLPDTRIHTDEFGKPRAESGVCFNLSHSGDYAVLAVADNEIGVDIERARDITALKMGKIVFCENEMELLEKSGGNTRLFFDLWTKKEALLKCMGKGFHRNAKSVDVSGDYYDEDKTRYYFKLYRFDDYTLAACSTKNNFPDNLEFVEV